MSLGDLGYGAGGYGSLGGGRRGPKYPALPPEEAQGALAGIRGAGLSSLAYVGSVLDKFGGRAVRGSLDALMGKGGAREILSVVPFSDTLGLTDPGEIAQHRGAKLLEHATGYDPEQARGHWGAWAERNLLAPAVEMALDPSMYVGGVGALTKGGAAAAKLGKVPNILQKGYLEALGRGERTLVHGLTGRPAVSVVKGATGAAEAANDLLRRVPAIAQAQDVTGKFLTDTALTHLKAWTDPISGWIANKGIQLSHSMVKHPEMAELERGVKEAEAGMRLSERNLLGQVPAGPERDAYQQQLYRYWNQAREKVDPSFHDQAFVRSLPQEAHDVASRLREVGQQVPFAQETGAGLRTKQLGDVVSYGMRERNPLYALNTPEARVAQAPALNRARLLRTEHQAMKRRLPGTTGYAGGTEELEDLITKYGGMDPRKLAPEVYGAPGAETYMPGQLHESIRRRLGLEPGTAFSVRPGGEEAKWAAEAAGFIGSVDKSRLLNPVTGKVEPYFVRNPIQMATKRGMLGAEASTSARTITHALGQMAKPLEAFASGEAKVNIYDVLKSTKMHGRQGVMNAADALGITPEHVADFLAEAPGASNLRQQVGGVAERAGLVGTGGVGLEDLNTLMGGGEAAGAGGRGLGLGDLNVQMRRGGRGAQDLGVEAAAEAGEAAEHRARVALLKQHGVDATTAQELTQLLPRGGPPPYELTKLERVGQKILGPTKNALYTMWLSSHVRNANTGRLQALTEAGVNPFSRSYEFARRMLRNPERDLDPGIRGVKGTDQLLTEAYADRIIGTHAGELAGQLPEGLQPGRFATSPLAARPTMGQAFGDFKRRMTTGSWDPKEWVNPIGEKGAGVQLGRAMNTLVEDNLRLGQYIDMRRRGFARDVARERTLATHFDYERGMGQQLRRLTSATMAFPTFTYFNVPKQFGLAATHPGRIGGPLRFAGGGVADEEGYVPRYLQGGLNFPVPATGLPEGTIRYLTSLGTPMEEAFGHLKVGGGAASNLQRTLVDLASMGRPDVKAAVEFVFGRQLHTNRPLSELDAGRLAALTPYIGEDATTLLAQAISGSPLSRVGTTAGMLMDPRKLTPGGATMNLARLLTGVKSSDVDIEKQQSIDERRMLEEALGRSRTIRQGAYFYVPKGKEALLSDRDRQLMQLFATVEKQARERRAQQQNAQFGNP